MALARARRVVRKETIVSEGSVTCSDTECVLCKRDGDGFEETAAEGQ